MLSGLQYLCVGSAAFGAGMVNAIAGGGTLISFPVLTAVGIPPVAANVTNTVALCPGMLGGIFAQRRDLDGQATRLWMTVPTGMAGGVLGGILLIKGSEQSFRALIPYLILVATTLLATQDRIRRWLMTHEGHHARQHSVWHVSVPVGVGAVYGGYFGAGLGVILLAVLGLVLEDTLTRLNALKQTIALAVNLSAAVYFLFSGQVLWTVAVVMAVGALTGGSIGGRLAGRIRPSTLRAIVVTLGYVVAVVYLVK
jgi:uncharacterized membrane protein YfcA